MRVKIDDELCESCESCVEICPEIFQMIGDIAVTKMEEVPEELEEACREAADTCPMVAIIIEE